MEAFLEACAEANKDVTIRQEFEISNEDVHEADLIVSLGNDRTFVRASVLAEDWSLPILGINTQKSSE